MVDCARGVNDSIDFLCHPNFDSPTLFAALPDAENGVIFQIQPQLKKAPTTAVFPRREHCAHAISCGEVAELTDSMLIGTDGEQPDEIIRYRARYQGEGLESTPPKLSSGGGSRN